MSLDDLLTDPGFFADPYPAYHTLREQAPVYWSAAWGGWVLTRYDDVTCILREYAQFSSAGRVHLLLNRLPEQARRETAMLQAHYAVGIAHSDPPDHTRLRALLSRAFTPRRLEGLRSRVQAVINSLLADVEARGDGQIDVIADLAYPLPAIIVAEMIGAPTEDREKFRQWALDINALFSGGGYMRADAIPTANHSLVEMRTYILALADTRRRQPTDDLLGLLVAAHDKGTLSEGELVSTCVTLFVAGHETTTNQIGNGLLALLRRPDQLGLLRDNPEVMESAVEELLRFDTPVQRGWRLAREDCRLDGQTIRQGELLLPMIGAANRDPAHFPDPDRLDLRRAPNRHLAFGYGIHFCLGAPLARIEIPLALSALLRRYPRLRLIDTPLVWRQDVALRGVEALPVAFD